ncbi:kinase-like domain-containing protein [Tricharina praecox]|uniref:kinase-like domain-containing protein n=1 Tax=Tricharina praecox TaxID=43433 RepID=UPI0022204A1C|nr:kinase-like domain-containing protein [Tricharina praecox]KAI5846061.1 kinase-like domain-containing protein [Tricharina praecox]
MSLAEQFDVLEVIGRGSFGLVHRVRRKRDGKILVRKTVFYGDMKDKDRQQLTAECGILSQVKHPNVVEYFDREHDKVNATLNLYMEYCGNGDLGHTIKQCRRESTLLPEPIIWTWFTQIVLALYRCHNGVNPPELGTVSNNAPHAPVPSDRRALKILHRDLKPGNIFLGEGGDVKLGDFGLSKMMAPEQQLANTYVGTPYYMSPELVSEQPYTHKSDIWSLGCIIYELCSLAPPFDGRNIYSLCDRIKNGQYTPIPKSYSSTLKNVIDLCLQVDPRKRPDTNELLDMEIFRVMRKERELVLIRRELKSIEEQLQAREDSIQQRESQLQKDVEDMREALVHREHQMWEEIDASLRAQWEVLAANEIKRHVEIEEARLQSEYDARLQVELEARLQVELEARLNIELQRKIREYDLVPRSQRESYSPPTTTSADSSGSSSIFSNQHDSPPQNHRRAPILMPDSPADVTMASPSAWNTPGNRRHYHMSGEPPKFGQMLPDSEPRTRPGSTANVLTSPTQSRASSAAQMLDNPPRLEPTGGFTQLRRPAIASTGSPSRAASSRRGIQRAETTGQLPSNRRDSNGSGSRAGSSEGTAGEARGRSIIEIGKSRRLAPAPKWDPSSEDAPSPFRKVNTRRMRS